MFVIAIDFDGTIVEHAYPEIGNANPGAIRVMKKLIDSGSKIVLNTMRSGDDLAAAVSYIHQNGIELYGINNNPTQHSWTTSPKVYAQIYIDDAALGCPLRHGAYGARPMVDWEFIDEMLDSLGVYETQIGIQ